MFIQAILVYSKITTWRLHEIWIKRSVFSDGGK